MLPAVVTIESAGADVTDTGSRPVVVLGAGPVGVMAASLLGQQGVEVLLLDRWSEVYAEPRAVHLDDEVYRLLACVGVADEFASVARPSLGLRMLDRGQRVIAEFPRDPHRGRHGFPQANMFDQPDLERILRDNLRRFPTVRLRGDTEVLAVRQAHQDGAVVEFEDRTTGEREELRAEYVLAADGANSATRNSMGTRMRELGFEQRWLVVDIATDAELDAWEGVQQVCDTERAATYMRVGLRRHRWEFRLLDGESADDYADPERLLPLLAPWTRELGPDRLEVVRRAEYTFRAQVADRWRDRRVFLLGDAAHLTPPFIGQGIGAGLRDAWNLTWKLAGVLRGELDEAVLDTYEVERKPHATFTVRAAVLMGRAMTSGGRTGDVLRRVLAPRLHLVPGLRSKVLSTESPRLHRSSLVVRSLAFGPLPGRLAPNAPLRHGTRLDDVAPGRFLVATTGAVTEAQRSAVLERGAAVLDVVDGGPLHRWLRRGRARAAVVRPDGTVLAAGKDLRDVLRYLPTFRTGGPPART